MAINCGKISVMTREDIAPGSFDITTGHGSLHFLAEDKAAAESWVAAINQTRSTFMKEEDRGKLAGDTSQIGIEKGK